jgi:hypothetical protein
MLVALLPDQVDLHWDILKVAIERSLPPIAINRTHSMNKVLECLLSGIMICWLVVEGNKIVGFVVTTVSEDFCTDTRTLILYIIFGEANRATWEDSYDTLYKHAKNLDCSFMGGYTIDNNVVNICKSFGCSDQHYCILEVR